MPKDHIDTSHWTFLTNHAHVLHCIARDSAMIMRNIAKEVGITERAVQLIIADLAEAGCIIRTRAGRCNTYRIHRNLHLRHPVERQCLIGSLVDLICADAASTTKMTGGHLQQSADKGIRKPQGQQERKQ